MNSLGRALAAVIVVGASAALVSCGGEAKQAPKAVAFDTTTPHWEDAFDKVPDILLVVRPQALSRDPVYGPLLKSMSRFVAARAPAGVGTRTAQVLEASEDVIIGTRRRSADPADEGDAVVVLRGVRADMDPGKMVDDRGLSMWSANAPPGRVQELTRERERPTASLFVLPQRSWVIAVGEARTRARQAFNHPFNRPAPTKDADALILLRLDGPSLVEHVPRLRRGSLEPLGHSLLSVTVALRPGTAGLTLSFLYEEEGAAAFAETTLKDVVSAFGTQGTERTKWLGSAAVERQEVYTVIAKVSLPPRLLTDLPDVSAADLGM